MNRTHIALLGTLAALLVTIACSTNSKQTVSSPVSAGTSLQPAALKTVEPAASQPTPVAVTRKASKPIVYKSRDYGVSFHYPWQYSFLNARVLANGDASLLPTSDGHEGQLTLARIDVPKGFYPDTNFEAGYFTLSLNPDLEQQECESLLTSPKGGKLVTETINGVEFRSMESASGGRGQSSRLRQYVAFANATCYELEMGVKTRNDDGLAREVDSDQVLRRLQAILKSVQITPATEPALAADVESSAPSTVSQN